MLSLFYRDIKVAFSAGGSIGTSLLFFLTTIVLTPFAVGSNHNLLQQLSAGLIWFFALLSILLGLDRLFQTDKEDGSLDIILACSDFPALALNILAKITAYWLSTVFPLVIAAPLLSLLLNPDFNNALALAASLCLGTIAITAIGAAGAALTTALPRGGVLLSILILPLVIPIIIFGIATAANIANSSSLQPLYFLLALTLFFMSTGPIAAACALKFMSE